MKFLNKVLILYVFTIFSSNSLQAQVLVPSSIDTHQIKSLNGEWKFRYIASSNPGSDSLFYRKSFDVGSWSNIKVPGNWELQGFATPHYGGELKTGTGLYRTTFSIPPSWKGRQIYIAFGGVAFGYAVYINGQYVGSFSSAYNLHTFNISSFVLPGRSNILAVKVITHPRGWQFDTNDQWSLSGIFRDVALFELPLIHIKNVITQTFVYGTSAGVNIHIEIERSMKSKFPQNLRISGQLFEPTGKLVREFTISAKPEQQDKRVLKFNKRLKILHPKLWSAETPYLYTLRLKLESNSSEIQQYTQQVGVRQITSEGGILKLNGMPIKLKGVDYPELSPVNGRAMTNKEIKRDLMLMRSANINFIRTSHYPHSREFLHLCDSMGMYVMDEVPFGFGNKLLFDTSYLPILKLRAKATIWRDKDHPSVIIWSLGNENPLTKICIKTGKYVRELDSTRPICFPQTSAPFRSMMKTSIPDSLNLLLDLHYPSISLLRKLAGRIHHPFIASEYAHALGLGFGLMDSTYEIMYEYPKLAGGAVWDFADQGILRKSTRHIPKDDFVLSVWPTPDSVYDANGYSGTDGIVYANRIPQVDYWEVRKVYSPLIGIDDTLQYKKGKNLFKLKLINRFDFTNLSKVSCKWQLFGDTTILGSGEVPLFCLPRDTMTLKIDTKLPADPKATFYYLRLMFTNKEGYQFYEKTYPVKLKHSKSLLSRNNFTKKIIPRKKGDKIISNQYQLTLKKSDGTIIFKNKIGSTIILDGPYPRVGRKPTLLIQSATTASKNRSRSPILWSPFLLSDPEINISKFNSRYITVHYKCKPQTPSNGMLTGNINYNFSNRGYIRVKYDFQGKGNGAAIETGISFIVPDSLTEFRWVGKGPYAAYPGKDRLSEFGIYHLNINGLYFPGNREEVNCALFSDSKGNGFAIVINQGDISVERSKDGIIVSCDSHVAGRFSKFERAPFLSSFEAGNKFAGDFTIVPLASGAWPKAFKNLFGNGKGTAKAFHPFYNSYDQ